MIEVALALLLATALAVALLLALDTFAAFWLAVYVVVIAEVVGIIEALSLFRGVTSRNVLLAQVALFAFAAAALILRRGRLVWPRFPRVQLRQVIADEPLLAVMFVVVGTAIAYELALAVLTPPNNWDSMSYHLSRAAAWYQHHGVAYVDAHTERENAYQPNAEILMLWTFLFAGRDTFAAAWQWFAEIASLGAIYLIAQRLGFGRREALFGALLFAALSQTALQASTTQNDLLVASLVVASVAFLTTKEKARLWLAATALGVAVGTKLTALFAFPPLAIAAVVLLPRRELARLAGVVVLAVAVLGSYGYVLNVKHTGSLLGSQTATAAFEQHSWGARIVTLITIPLQIVTDIRVIPKFPPNEDFSFFGPLGLVVVLPVVVVTLSKRRRNVRMSLATALALTLPLYVLALAFVYRWNPWIGRFLLTPCALVAPLFAEVYRTRRYAQIAAGVATASLFATLLFSETKPAGVGSAQSIWTMNRVQAQTIKRRDMRPVLAAIAHCVPAHARLGYVLAEDDWDYPLFGTHFTRTLVRVDSSRPFREAGNFDLDWLLIRRGLADPASPGWSKVNFRLSGLALLQRMAPSNSTAPTRHPCVQATAPSPA
jgi:hypothetical protein